MREITVSRVLNASPSAVWEVLADYAAVADWNRYVTRSHTSNGVATGLGAQRFCKMRPAGNLTESITAWEPESLLVLQIDSTSLNPIGEGVIDYVLRVAEGDKQSTAMEIRYAFTAKWGRIGQVISPLVAKNLAKAFEDVLTDLETAAKTPSAGDLTAAENDER